MDDLIDIQKDYLGIKTNHNEYFFIIINMNIRVSLRAPRLILQTLKLTII
jgi:hypothetical protein